MRNASTAAGQPVKTVQSFSRIVVLDNETGIEVSAHEPDVYPYSYLIPAGDKIVFGGTSQYYEIPLEAFPVASSMQTVRHGLPPL